MSIRTTGLKPDGRGHDNDVFRPNEKTPFPLKDKAAALALKGEMRDEAGMFIRNPHQPEGVHITATAKPLRDANGDLKGAVTVFTDSTERRRTEELQGCQTEILEVTTDFECDRSKCYQVSRKVRNVME